MKLLHLSALYTLIGCAVFFLAAFFLATGRFGPGLLLLCVCMVFLASAARASRRAQKHGDRPR